MVISTVFKTHGSVFANSLCQLVSDSFFRFFKALNGFLLPIFYEIREAGSQIESNNPRQQSWSTIHASKLLFFRVDGQKDPFLFFPLFSFIRSTKYPTISDKKVTVPPLESRFSRPIIRVVASRQPQSRLTMACLFFNPRVVVPGGILYTNIH